MLDEKECEILIKDFHFILNLEYDINQLLVGPVRELMALEHNNQRLESAKEQGDDEPIKDLENNDQNHFPYKSNKVSDLSSVL